MVMSALQIWMGSSKRITPVEVFLASAWVKLLQQKKKKKILALIVAYPLLLFTGVAELGLSFGTMQSY